MSDSNENTSFDAGDAASRGSAPTSRLRLPFAFLVYIAAICASGSILPRHPRVSYAQITIDASTEYQTITGLGGGEFHRFPPTLDLYNAI
jgi:hypothetical protein